MIYTGDCRIVLPTLDAESVQCCVTSPPYWGLRNYGVDGQIGVEADIPLYVGTLVDVFRAIRRVLRNDGILWLNLGDAYNAYNGNRGPSKGRANRRSHEVMPALPKGHGLTCKTLKAKDLMGLPWRVAFALQDDGWYLRQDVIWHKLHAKPERVKDRPHRTHEYLFLFSKSPKYRYDLWPGRKYSIWDIPPNTRGQHPAAFPDELARSCILSGSRVGDTVLDPFSGSGTTVRCAQELGRLGVGIELNRAYVEAA